MFGPDNQTPVDVASLPDKQVLNPDTHKGNDENTHKRHATLMTCLRDERDLQGEERIQMAIDNDYYDHLQWREEDAQVLMDRGQAPLVFNESRQTIDWVCGVQKRMRTDETILPREEADQQSAEVKSKVFKYVSDANLAQWHESRAYKQAVMGGLGWLEEGINTDPGQNLIYSGSEDWRNVYRDSRSRQFDMKDGRYMFRRKQTDLDYAIALLPEARQHLVQQAGISDVEHGAANGDDIWYLGERLTGSTDLSGGNSLSSQFRDRSAYIGGSEVKDSGRRLSVNLIECWYRVPESIKVFAGGPQRGKEFDPKNPGHVQLEADRWKMYSAVTQRMRVMIATEAAPLWDGKSPLRHQNFLLVPIWGYRRGRDGLCYGLMRGMRDINDDINKRASKAIYAASSNRMLYESGAFKDIEVARQEAARPDMMLEVKKKEMVSFEKPQADMAANMELLSFDREMLRNVGGVTDANLGRNSNAVSGKAIGLQQDQGSLATSELPDNLRLAKQLAGRLRLSHIEQFMTEKQVIRIVGEGQPVQWVTVNDAQEDGSVLNDIANSEADYIIGERDYRETYAQAAMEQMMELLGKIATYAPQVVMNVLDLVIDSAEIKNKDEWVARIRKLNGQRDPTKAPTPEDQAAQQQGEAEAKAQKQMQMDTMQAGLDKLRGEVSKLDTEAMLKRVESMFSALQAAQIVAMNPTVAPVADTIAAGAGFKDQAGQDPNLPQPTAPVEQVPAPMSDMGNPISAPVQQEQGIDPAMTPQAPPDSATGLEGMQQGIETPTGADNGPAMN
jgi:hypothetical protein